MNNIYEFDGGSNRIGIIDIEPDGECHICHQSRFTLRIDASEGEYEPGQICLSCVANLFRDAYEVKEQL